MKRLTKFQEAQLAHAVSYERKNAYSLHGIALLASNDVRYFRDGFWDTCTNAFIRVGVAHKTTTAGHTTTRLLMDKAEAYVKKYNCTEDLLHLDRAPLKPFDKAQLRFLAEHNRMTTYPLQKWSRRGYTYPRLKEALVRLEAHGFIASSWFNNWTELCEDTITQAGRDYVDNNEISLSPLD